MSLTVNWANSLGFRHVIEDGLAILSGAEIQPDRRAYVLRDLAQLLVEAKRGSDLVQQSAFFVASADHSAFESYSLLDHYLGRTHDENQWTEMLRAAEVTLEELRKEAPKLNEADKSTAENLLGELLARLMQEPNSGIASEPENIAIGG